MRCLRQGWGLYCKLPTGQPWAGCALKCDRSPVPAPPPDFTKAAALSTKHQPEAPGLIFQKGDGEEVGATAAWHNPGAPRQGMRRRMNPESDPGATEEGTEVDSLVSLLQRCVQAWRKGTGCCGHGRRVPMGSQTGARGADTATPTEPRSLATASC